MAAVASLQEYCLAYIAASLEALPLEYLKQISAPLSQRILLNLPLADIQHLEGSGFGSGITVQDNVWKILCKQLLKDSPTAMWKLLPRLSDFHCTLTFILLNGLEAAELAELGYVSSANLCLHLLFGISQHPQPLGSFFAKPEGFVNEKWLIPKRHLQYFKQATKSSELISLMMHKFDFKPREVHIICERLEKIGLLKQDKAILEEFLNKVKQVRFSWDDKHSSLEAAGNIPASILKSIISGPTPSLESLWFDGECYNEAVENYLSQITGLMNGSKSSPLYTKLKSLVIVGEDHPDYEVSSTVLNKLATLIQNQCNLEVLQLRHVAPYATLPNSFYRSLINIVKKANFKLLELEIFAIPLASLQELVHHFLASPCTCEQTLILDGLEITNQQARSIRSFATLSGSLPSHDRPILKSLCLSGMTLPTAVVSQLLSYPQLHLKTLTLQFLETRSNENFLTALVQHPHFQVENIHLDDCDDSCLPSTAEVFESLLSNSHLQSLQFNNCGVGKQLLSLAQGLQKQAQTGNLCKLSITDDSLQENSDSQLQQVFDALFQLPQLPELEIALDLNLEPSHLDIMHDSWLHNAKGKKLKCLDITRNNLPEDRFPLQQMTQKLE